MLRDTLKIIMSFDFVNVFQMWSSFNDHKLKWVVCVYIYIIYVLFM